MKVGDIYNECEVMELLPDPKCPIGGRHPTARVRCFCGKIFICQRGNLSNGNTRSCGCLNIQLLIGRSTTHGMSKTPIYHVWEDMISRCSNPNSCNWDNYGGRGIEVCERWRKFENFFQDMGDIPEDGLTIDRKNNEGNYEKDNCRWATRLQQARNRRPHIKE
jgi:hypothetical protein